MCITIQQSLFSTKSWIPCYCLVGTITTSCLLLNSTRNAITTSSLYWTVQEMQSLQHLVPLLMCVGRPSHKGCRNKDTLLKKLKNFHPMLPLIVFLHLICWRWFSFSEPHLSALSYEKYFCVTFSNQNKYSSFTSYWRHSTAVLIAHCGLSKPLYMYASTVI